ncbi:HAD family hydrolase [bacterium]|nr:HAD family hydrolase [bacterium]
MNKPKILIFDVDGVLIRFPYYYSQELENKGYKNAVKYSDSFFNKGLNNPCLEGKDNIEKIIMPFLRKFGWEDTAENYLQQQFQFESNYLDKDFLSLIQQFRNKDIKCYLGTDQEKNKAKFLLDKMGFNKKFDGHFISCYVGYRKCHDNFWIHVLKELKNEFSNIKPNEIAFFDDIQNNVNVALKHGIQAFLFTDMKNFYKDLSLLKLSEKNN